jgi:twinkle protein
MKSNSILITEGEEDAEAAYHMLGGKVSCVSLPFGASCAEAILKHNLEALEKYDRVFLCFDSDREGRAATQKALDILAPGKAYSVLLPPGYKDACDLCKEGVEVQKLFRDAVYSAKSKSILGLLTAEEARKRTLRWYTQPQMRFGVPTGFAQLDELIGGWRQKEITILAANTGIGKSTLIRQLIYNLAMTQHERVLYLSLEDSIETSLIHLCETHLRMELIKDKTINLGLIEAVLDKLLTKIHLADNDGDYCVESIERKVDYGVRGYGCRFVFIDHLTIISEGGGSEATQTTQHLMNRLRSLANRLSISIVAVVHLRRETMSDNEKLPSLNRLKHSSAIPQVVDCVLGLHRDRQTNIIKLSTLKASRLWGVYGDVYLEYSDHRFKEV